MNIVAALFFRSCSYLFFHSCLYHVSSGPVSLSFFSSTCVFLTDLVLCHLGLHNSEFLLCHNLFPYITLRNLFYHNRSHAVSIKIQGKIMMHKKS
jgi:hypothetical protein